MKFIFQGKPTSKKRKRTIKWFITRGFEVGMPVKTARLQGEDFTFDVDLKKEICMVTHHE